MRWICFALLVGCTPEPSSPDDGGPGGGDDPLIGDPLVVGRGVEIQLASESVTGELVAAYDHSTWWHDASDEITYGVFRANQLLAYPNDASMAFVSSYEIVNALPVALSASSYRDTMRTYGVMLGYLPLVGVNYVITGNDGYHLDEDGFGNFAWDFELTDDAGRRLLGSGTLNEQYYVWDAPVYLPTGGTVIEVVRDIPDNYPGSYEDGAVANMVGVHLYGKYYLYLLHFRQDTIPLDIQPNVVLPAGTYLGRVGNSGVTLEPHLHVVVLWWQEEASRSWSVPAEFSSVYWSDAPTGPGVYADYLVPGSGTWLSEDTW